MYYITHSDTPSTAVTVPGMPPTHKTHLRELPFHAPGAPPVVKEGVPSDRARPQADKDFLVSVIRDGKWKEYEEWDSWNQPFQGWGKYISLFGWFGILQFGKVPTWMTMIVISLGGRFLTYVLLLHPFVVSLRYRLHFFEKMMVKAEVHSEWRLIDLL